MIERITTIKDQRISEAGELATVAGTFGQELSNFLQPLFTHRYIQHCPPPHEHSIQLTEAGERTIAQLWNIVEKAENRVFSGFSDAEKAQLHDFLKRIQVNCEEVTHA